MERYETRKNAWLCAALIYFICFGFRFFEYFFIRTDCTFFGEAFIHKTLGIIILFVTAKLFSYKPTEIGFSQKSAVKNILRGFLIGFCCFAFSYAIEIRILKDTFRFNYLGFFVTSYSVNGNLGNQTELIFFIICILGNIINVIMEEGIFRGLLQKLFERRYSFFASAVFASILFGLWHCIAPARSFFDGLSNKNQLIINLAILIGSSTLVGLKYAMLYKITGSIYAGMTEHFVNNTLINILHVVSYSGIDQLQTIRISIAQTVSFIIVLILYLRKVNLNE
ncbi:MAG: CPBP family intramembrane metalloprotease [Treponema sp.]|nr:CPBP family intramembrane metalloprotease [Treponema sp.]